VKILVLVRNIAFGVRIYMEFILHLSVKVFKPSQIANWWRGLARGASRSPSVLAIPAFGRIAGFYITDTLTLTGENAYATDFKVRLRAFADLAED